jgi:hypothetical protein
MENTSVSNQIHTKITPMAENAPFGDIKSLDNPTNILQIVFQNVNGIHKANSWLELNKLATNIKDLQIDIFSVRKNYRIGELNPSATEDTANS